MAGTFHLTIAKIGENLFDGDARSVTLPGAEGVFQVLPNHESFVSHLKTGEAKVVAADGTITTLTVSDGSIAEVSNNQATILL